MVPKCVTVPVTTKSLSEKFTFSPKKVGLIHQMRDYTRVCAAKHANLIFWNALQWIFLQIYLNFFGQDYDADRLMLSYLQLSEGTVVLLDETRLESGQVCFLYAERQAVYIQFTVSF